MYHWPQERPDAEYSDILLRAAREAQKRQRREARATVYLCLVATAAVFLIGMAFTRPDAMPTYYPSCSWAKLMGAAPIARDMKGYREALDTNRDGIACEPGD